MPTYVYLESEEKTGAENWRYLTHADGKMVKKFFYSHYFSQIGKELRWQRKSI
jgi:hypothetical protein